MQPRLQTFFTAQSQLLAQGRIPSMARPYVIPAPGLPARLMAWHLLPSRAALMETYLPSIARSGRRASGACAPASRRNGGTGHEACKAQVTWFYVGPRGRRLGRTVANYFVILGSAGPQVAMMEFRRVAFPQLHAWFSENASELPNGHIP